MHAVRDEGDAHEEQKAEREHPGRRVPVDESAYRGGREEHDPHGEAGAVCPQFPGGARAVHVPFDDPPKLAEDAASKEEALAHYRRVRDEIREFVERLPEAIAEI